MIKNRTSVEEGPLDVCEIAEVVFTDHGSSFLAWQQRLLLETVLLDTVDIALNTVAPVYYLGVDEENFLLLLGHFRMKFVNLSALIDPRVTSKVREQDGRFPCTLSDHLSFLYILLE